jgi:hypothetical protein
VIIHINAELNNSVTEISISIIRIDVMIDHTSLIYIPVHQIDVLHSVLIGLVIDLTGLNVSSGLIGK